MNRFFVKEVSELSGVSIRTLHHYDKIGLLMPSDRNEKRYRLYTKNDLFRLQQILFYRELDIPLNKIREILDDPNFDIIKALESHKENLKLKKNKINEMIFSINKTINNIKKGENMKSYRELYKGLNKQNADKYHNEAIKKFGKEIVEKSEKNLINMGKSKFENIKKDFGDCFNKLFSLRDELPSSNIVQKEIENHYRLIRILWGTSNNPNNQAEEYSGLGELYVNDERYTIIEGEKQPEFALFLKNSMEYFVNNNLLKNL